MLSTETSWALSGLVILILLDSFENTLHCLKLQTYSVSSVQLELQGLLSEAS